jgi:hypothetical protein
MRDRNSQGAGNTSAYGSCHDASDELAGRGRRMMPKGRARSVRKLLRLSRNGCIARRQNKTQKKRFTGCDNNTGARRLPHLPVCPAPVFEYMVRHGTAY